VDNLLEEHTKFKSAAYQFTVPYDTDVRPGRKVGTSKSALLDQFLSFEISGWQQKFGSLFGTSLQNDQGRPEVGM
jgi:hypothetical protein